MWIQANWEARSCDQKMTECAASSFPALVVRLMAKRLLKASSIPPSPKRRGRTPLITFLRCSINKPMCGLLSIIRAQMPPPQEACSPSSLAAWWPAEGHAGNWATSCVICVARPSLGQTRRFPRSCCYCCLQSCGLKLMTMSKHSDNKLSTELSQVAITDVYSPTQKLSANVWRDRRQWLRSCVWWS